MKAAVSIWLCKQKKNPRKIAVKSELFEISKQSCSFDPTRSVLRWICLKFLEKCHDLLFAHHVQNGSGEALFATLTTTPPNSSLTRTNAAAAQLRAASPAFHSIHRLKTHHGIFLRTSAVLFTALATCYSSPATPSLRFTCVSMMLKLSVQTAQYAIGIHSIETNSARMVKVRLRLLYNVEH